MKKIYSVSVIIPFFNSEITIEKCILSALNQTYDDFEIILINDGSKDKTKELCFNIINNHKNYNKIKYFEIANSGVSAARNYGITKSTGEYITFLDSDDWLEENALEKMIDIVKRYNVDIVQSNLMQRFNKKNEVFYLIKEDLLVNNEDEKEKILNSIISYEFSKYKYMEKYGPTRCAGGKLYSKRIIKHYFNTNIYILEDGVFNFRAINNTNRIFIMKDCLYNYRINEFSASNRNAEDLVTQYKDVLEIMNEMNQYGNFTDSINSLKFELISAYITRILRGNKKYLNIKNKINNACKEIASPNELKKVKYEDISKAKRISLFLLQNKLYYILYIFYYIKMKIKG